jgi:hypothetical protein
MKDPKHSVGEVIHFKVGENGAGLGTIIGGYLSIMGEWQYNVSGYSNDGSLFTVAENDII